METTIRTLLAVTNPEFVGGVITGFTTVMAAADPVNALLAILIG